VNWWDAWISLLQNSLQVISVTGGLGTGFSIIILTVIARIVLLPLSWSCAYESRIRRLRLERLKPELERLRQRHQGDGQAYFDGMTRLYRRHGLSLADGRGMLGALVQMPVVIGMYQMLRATVGAGRFLWVSSLARPDLLIAIIAGLTTALVVLANPDLPAQARILLVALPAMLTFVFALKAASAVGLYWVASNGVAALQTLFVQRVVARRIRQGVIRI
jgi:YidC/Oxa1 family membrane protein insertase